MGYNKLTERLLSEGYTAERYPDHVMISGSVIDPKDPLGNTEGGFTYKKKYSDTRVYETPCGLLLLGETAISGLGWYGILWSHENDCPYVNCPGGCAKCAKCDKRPAPFGEGKGFMDFCPVHPADRPYEYEGSVEQLAKEREKRVREDKKKFLKEHPEICARHVGYNAETDTWEVFYDPFVCAKECSGHGHCPMFGKDLAGARGNIYFDIEAEGRDHTKDGTLFDGERFHEIHKGFQFFPSPVNLLGAEMCLKLRKEDLLQRIRYQHMTHLFDSLTLYRAEKGEIDLTVTAVNFRVIKKDVRDLEADLKDIAAGITVEHAVDRDKAAKEEKKRRIENNRKRREEKIRKEILSSKAIDEWGLARAERLLGKEEVQSLMRMREEELSPKKAEESPFVQLTLFQLLESAG